MKKGKFIVLEGLEGAGKSTMISTLEGKLNEKKIPFILTREPGGTNIAEEIRQILKTNSDNQEKLTNEAEILLFYAARKQLVEYKIKPALEKGIWVIGDRHDLSTQAYQGAGRGISFSFLSELKHFVLADFKPNFTFYLDISPEVGLNRAKNRGTLDRIEQESLDFFYRVREYYLKACQNDSSIICIDANHSIDLVKQNLLNKFLICLE